MTNGAPERAPIDGRLTSGNERLDDILAGGFPAHAINLVAGPPGSGKTILAQQYVFHNATVERPAVYLTTVSEPLEKVLRYGQTMAFFDAGAVGRAVFYEDLGELLSTKGLGGVLERIEGRVPAFPAPAGRPAERVPGRVAVDRRV